MNDLNNDLWAIAPTSLQQMLGRLRTADPAAATAKPTKSTPPMSAPSGIAVVSVTGILSKWRSWLLDIFGGTSLKDARAAVRQAASDPNIGAIVLFVDSPGGTVAGAGDLADAIFAARERKPVHAFIEDLGASAAYWVASQATSVSVNPTGYVGSIGVYAVLYDWSAAFAQQGIETHVIRAGKFKGTGVIGAPVDDEQLAEIQSRVDAVRDAFVAAVARGRGMSVNRVPADGRLFIGNEAVKAGLVGRVERFDEMLGRVAGDLRRAVEARREAENKILADWHARIQGEALFGEFKGRPYYDAHREATEKMKRRYPELAAQAAAIEAARAKKR